MDINKTITYFQVLSQSMDKVRAYLSGKIPSKYVELAKTKPDALSIEYSIWESDRRLSIARSWTLQDVQGSSGKLTRETKLSLAYLDSDNSPHMIGAVEAHNIPKFLMAM